MCKKHSVNVHCSYYYCCYYSGLFTLSSVFGFLNFLKNFVYFFFRFPRFIVYVPCPVPHAIHALLFKIRYIKKKKKTHLMDTSNFWLRPMSIRRNHFISFLTEKVQACRSAMSCHIPQETMLTQEPNLGLVYGKIGLILLTSPPSTSKLWTRDWTQAPASPCPQVPREK